MKFSLLLLLPLLLLAERAVLTVDDQRYEVKWDVKLTPCSDQHPEGCHRHTVGTRAPMVALVSVARCKPSDEPCEPIGTPFEQNCKTDKCADDSREDWVRVALRRWPK